MSTFILFFTCMWPFSLLGKPEEETLFPWATCCFWLSLLQCRSCELYFFINGILAFSYWIECCNTHSILQSCLSGSFQAWILYPVLNSSVDQTCLNNYSNYAANNRWLAFHLEVFPWELVNVNLTFLQRTTLEVHLECSTELTYKLSLFLFMRICYPNLYDCRCFYYWKSSGEEKCFLFSSKLCLLGVLCGNVS